MNLERQPTDSVKQQLDEILVEYGKRGQFLEPMARGEAKTKLIDLMVSGRRDELENVLPYLNDWAITEYYKGRHAQLNSQLDKEKS